MSAYNNQLVRDGFTHKEELIWIDSRLPLVERVGSLYES